MSNLWIIVFVLCWYPKTVSQTFHVVENKTDWFTASYTCQVQQGRLPSVNIYDHRLELKDLSDTKNISSPFWIAATYEIMDYNQCEPNYEVLCSDTFCQTIAISSENTNVEWRPCSECKNVSCAVPNGQLYLEADLKQECKAWPGAFKECKRLNSSLATRENVPFMEKVKTSGETFWLDEMTQINLAPDIRMQNRTCLYSFNGIIHEGNCSNTSVTTVCILVTHTVSTMVPSQTMYTADTTRTASTMVPSQTMYTADTTRTASTMVPSQTMYTSDTTHTTSTMVPSQTMYTADTTRTASTMVPSQTMYTTDTTRTASTMVPSQTMYTSDTTHTTSTMVPSQTMYTTDTTRTASTMVPSQTMYTSDTTHTTSTMVPSQTMYTTDTTRTASTMVPSQTMYTTDTTHTTSTMVPSQTMYTTDMTHTAEYSLMNKPVVTISTNRLDTSHSYMLDSSKKPTEKTSEKQTKEIWPILGSALGGFVVIIIVILIIIIVLRRRRMKNDPEKAFNYNANNKSAAENMSQTQNEYDTVLGESFALESTIAMSTRVSSTQEEEPVIYARPQKAKTNCRNPIDVPFSIKQLNDEKESTGLYNVVQKGMETRDIPKSFVNDDVLGKDYYDISFTELGKNDTVENVYNKANFNHSVRDTNQTVNMYDKANFSHESLEKNTGNDYDEAHVHPEILENNTGNDYDEANFHNDVLVRDSENGYEKEMFHRPGSSNYH